MSQTKRAFFSSPTAAAGGANSSRDFKMFKNILTVIRYLGPEFKFPARIEMAFCRRAGGCNEACVF